MTRPGGLRLAGHLIRCRDRIMARRTVAKTFAPLVMVKDFPVAKDFLRSSAEKFTKPEKFTLNFSMCEMRGV
jgi:hypothetical protein